jgi:molybdenum cofactor sulfurtransferase
MMALTTLILGSDKNGGAVRVSLGLVTNSADVYRLVQFAQTFLDTFPGESELPPRLHC